MMNKELCPLITTLSSHTSRFVNCRPICNHCCILMLFDFIFEHCDDPLSFIGAVRKSYRKIE